MSVHQSHEASTGHPARPRAIGRPTHGGPSPSSAGGIRPRSFALLAIALLLLIASACAPQTTTLIDPGGAEVAVTRATLRELERFAEDEQAVPLERVLYANGYRLIDTLHVVPEKGEPLTFDWLSVAATARWQRNGEVHIGEQVLRPARIEGIAPQMPAQPTTGPLDIAPTAAKVLGLRAPADAAGTALELPPASRVVLIFLDAFGYLRYTEARDAGLIPTLAAFGEPALGLTVYPPSTAVATAALLTGAPPEVNSVEDRGIRTTFNETLFDVVAAAGLRGVAIEGDALAFNMRSADVTLSGDRDGNGGTDDNVLANALAVIEAGTPDLLWIHFHGIDDVGHTYGPGTPEEEAKIVEVDAAVATVLAALPEETAVLIFADHGMHTVAEEGRLGNHGNLVVRDMLVPVWAFVK